MFCCRRYTDVAVLHKQRENGRETNVTHVIGNVKDKPCLIIDDMISTGGTIATTIEALLRANTKAQIYIAATHGLLIQNAEENLKHQAVREIFLTDTILVERELQLQTVSIVPAIAQAITRMSVGNSRGEIN